MLVVFLAASDYCSPHRDLLFQTMEKFYTELTLEALNLLKKKELIDAAKHFNLEVNESISKAELKS